MRHGAAEAGDGAVAARIAAVVAALRGAEQDWPEQDWPEQNWDIVSARVMRSRSGTDRQGKWAQEFDLRVRCLAAVPSVL